MPKLSDIRTIVEEPNLGITVLRSFPKETLIEAILELKRTSSEQYVKMREAEQQERIMQLSYQLNETQIRKELTEKLFALSENFADHKYGPNAIGNIGAGLASIWGNKSSTPTTTSPELGDEFIERIEKAKSQGMRWNKADKQPERQSTVIKKLEAWESGINRGLAADPDLYKDKKYEEILKTEGGEAFMVGLCENIESKYGIGPMSKYLKTRHKRCMEKLGKSTGANPVPATPVLTNTDHAIELIKRAWGDSLDDYNYNDIKKHLIRRLDSAGGVDKIELKSFRGLCDARSLPTFFEYTEKPEHPLDKLKDIKAGKYDEHFVKLLDDYRSEVEGK